MKNIPKGKREPTTKDNIEQRFWDKVEKTDECWNWTGCISSDHGQFQDIGKVIGAHVFSWKLHNGEIQKGMFVLHRCDNGKCVNPDHLFLGTQADNIQDMIKKGRRKQGRALGQRNGKYTHPEKTPRGEDSGRAKLTEKQVKEIRKKYIPIKYHYGMLSKEYNVCRDTIRKIVNRIYWEHI